MSKITQIDKDRFIGELTPHAIKGWHEYKVLPSLTIAQAILESGWGTSNKIPNNLFGIKADNSWNGKKKLALTHEYVGGVKIYVHAWFRVYDSIYESLQDRYVFLQKPRYAKVIGEVDYKKVCQEIWNAKYATDINYVSKLVNLIEQNKLYEIDSQAIAPIIVDKSSNWSSDAWNWASQMRILDGKRPKNDLSREELSIVLMRLFE